MFRKSILQNLEDLPEFYSLPCDTIQRIYSYLSTSDRWNFHKAFGKELQEIIYGKMYSLFFEIEDFDDFLRVEKDKGYAINSSIRIVDKQEKINMLKGLSKFTPPSSLMRRVYLFNTEFVHNYIRVILDWGDNFDQHDEEKEPENLQAIADQFNGVKYLDLEIIPHKFYDFHARIDKICVNGYEELGSANGESIIDNIRREAMGDETPDELVRKNLKEQNDENEAISTIATLFPKLEGLNAGSSFRTLKPLMKLKKLTLLSLIIQADSDSEFNEIFRNCKLKYFSLWSHQSLKIDELSNVALCKTLEVISMPPHLLSGIVKVLTKENLPRLKAIGVLGDLGEQEHLLDAKKLLDELRESLKLNVHEIITWPLSPADKPGQLNYGDFAVFPHLNKLVIHGVVGLFGDGVPKLPILPKLQTFICITRNKCDWRETETECIIASIENLIASCPELLEVMLPPYWIECCFLDDSLNANTKAALRQLIGGCLADSNYCRVSEINERLMRLISTRNIFTLIIGQPKEISFLEDVVPAELWGYYNLRTGTKLFDPWSDPSNRCEKFSKYFKHIAMRNIREIETNSHSLMYS